MIDIQVSKEKHITMWIVEEETSSVLDEIVLKTVHKHKKVTKRGKSSKAANKVRPIENINRNLKCFLVQNEVP